jgi:(2Fe-2S) ferredoxin
MPAFEHHIFVCGNKRPEGHPRGCCNPQESDELCEAFRSALRAHGLGTRVRANKAGCLDQCECGPTVVIYPQGTWYGHVRPEDAAEIVERTILRGEIIPDLLIPDECLNSKGQVAWTVNTPESKE